MQSWRAEWKRVGWACAEETWRLFQVCLFVCVCVCHCVYVLVWLPSQIPTLELPYGGQFWGWAILSTSVIRIAHLNYKVLLCNVCAVYCFHVSANQLDCVSQIFRPTSKQRKTTAMISQVIYSLCSGLNRNTPSVSGRDIWESCDVEGRPTPGSGNQAWGTCGPTPGWGTDTWAAGTAWSWR